MKILKRVLKKKLLIGQLLQDLEYLLLLVCIVGFIRLSDCTRYNYKLVLKLYSVTACNRINNRKYIFISIFFSEFSTNIVSERWGLKPHSIQFLASFSTSSMGIGRRVTRRMGKAPSSARRASDTEVSPPESPISPTESIDSFHSQFYLTSCGNPGLWIISVVLDDTNYDNWCIAITIALRKKNQHL